LCVSDVALGGVGKGGMRQALIVELELRHVPDTFEPSPLCPHARIETAIAAIQRWRQSSRCVCSSESKKKFSMHTGHVNRKPPVIAAPPGSCARLGMSPGGTSPRPAHQAGLLAPLACAPIKPSPSSSPSSSSSRATTCDVVVRACAARQGSLLR
jgi:hypothetical protein